MPCLQSSEGLTQAFNVVVKTQPMLRSVCSDFEKKKLFSENIDGSVEDRTIGVDFGTLFSFDVYIHIDQHHNVLFLAYIHISSSSSIAIFDKQYPYCYHD